jgi:hypothetical protein
MSRSILTTPSFWYLFIAFVVLSLYALGEKMVGDNTALAIARRAALAESDTVQQLRSDSAAMALTISQQEQSIVQKENTIAELGQSLLGYQDAIQLYRDSVRTDKLQIRALARQLDSLSHATHQATIVPTPPSASAPPPAQHPYGAARSLLVFFNACNCRNLRIWVDGKPVGTPPAGESVGRVCGQSAGLPMVVEAGAHRVSATAEGRSWDFVVTTTEDECVFRDLVSR